MKDERLNYCNSVYLNVQQSCSLCCCIRGEDSLSEDECQESSPLLSDQPSGVKHQVTQAPVTSSQLLHGSGTTVTTVPQDISTTNNNLQFGTTRPQESNPRQHSTSLAQTYSERQNVSGHNFAISCHRYTLNLQGLNYLCL